MQAWLQGRYMYDALLSTVSQVFSKKGSDVKTYIESPFPLFETKEETKQREKEEEMRKINASLEIMKMRMASINKKFEAKEE